MTLPLPLRAGVLLRTCFASILIAAGAAISRGQLGVDEGDAIIPGTPWHVHDGSRPQPPLVIPGTHFSELAPPPSDAVVLFDGKDLSQWEASEGGPPSWKVANGVMEVVPANGHHHNIRTKGRFPDFQLHLEFATPATVQGSGQGRGNSGVLINGMYEVQILDSYENPTYPDGQAGALYGQSPPLVNASRAPGQWQTYDLIFESPRWSPTGELLKKAVITVIHNGVLVQNHREFIGGTDGIHGVPHKSLGTYLQPHSPEVSIELQEHKNPVRFRNIWIRAVRAYDQPGSGTESAGPAPWRQLFNGRDLTGWTMFLAAPPPETEVPGLKRDSRGNYLEPIGFNRDPLHVFTVETVDGRPAIHVSGAGFGVITTVDSFANFHLRMQVKWGDKIWGYKRATHAPLDAGLLYFARGPAGIDHLTWPRCLEFQIQVGDFGDLFALGMTEATATARSSLGNVPAGTPAAYVYDPQGPPIVFVARRPIGNRCRRAVDAEKPRGEWNSLDLICRDGSSIHIVNGQVVNRIQRARIPTDHGYAPLDSGQICLQTEGGEVYYRDIEIQPLPQAEL